MTAEQCTQVWARAAACMEEEATGRKVDPADDVMGEMLPEMCNDDEMRSLAAQSLSCLDATTCAEFDACFRRPSLDERLRHAIDRLPK
jgi:hypothetical protein